MDCSVRQLTRRQCLTIMAGAAAATLAPGFCPAETDKNFLRVAVSTETLAGANINDARAAYRVWMEEVDRQTGHVIAEVVPGVFISSEELIQDVRQGTVQCYGVTALEYARLAALTDPDFLVLQDYLADGMEYVLLVHNSSPFKTIADLKGAQIVSHTHRDMVLMPAWLGTLLAANNLPQPERFFGSMTPYGKINQVVLPVFFRRADGACLARQSWQTAVDLNPQLGRDLRPLAVSPKIIPIAIGFRRNCNAIGRKNLIDSMLSLSTAIAGQQIAALYQSRRFVLRSASIMNSTLEMVRQYERISAQLAEPRKGKP
jgi:ABC-type phosphate/phosphonate transport system substrate-binding protein